MPIEPPGSWPFYDQDEIEAVVNILASGKVNQWTGDHVARFETAFQTYSQVPHAIAVANGTVALELALRALGIGPGDEVIVTSRSFVASASCTLLVGATPVFADIDRDSQNITAETIVPLISNKTKAIIPVHLAGWPCDMDAIMKLGREHNLLVIEDCAQAVGARWNGKPVGSFGHAATVSFCQDKIISTGGEGGLVMFQDATPAQWARSYKDHGKALQAMAAHGPGSAFRYVHEQPGTNYRMTEMQAAIGLVQLGKLDDWIETRQSNARVWREHLGKLSCLRIPWPSDSAHHAFYKFYAFVEPEQLGAGYSRDTILSALDDIGVRAFSGSCPEIYREKAFVDVNVKPHPVAQELGQTSLMFEVHPTLKYDEHRDTAERVASLISDHQR